MIQWVLQQVLARAEARIGVRLDYARQIARTDLGLMLRYGKIFGFLDPNRKVPAAAYHVARLRGAISADCGTCVEAEINLAKAAQNQILRTAAIEIARKRPEAIVVALHPGTVATDLSAPYAGRHPTITPQRSAQALLEVLARLTPAETGTFWDWKGERVEG